MGANVEEREKGGAPTLASIAVRVGVSINTVSRALRAPNTVRPELRREIAKAMDELNYVPNRLAGGLSGTRSDIVGVVVTSLYYSEFASIIDALQSALLKDNLQVMLANTRYDPDQEITLVRSILSWRPAAVAIIGVDHPTKVTELLTSSGVPVVEMWDVGGDIIDSAVGMDHREAGGAQADHMIACGYRHLAFLGSMRENDMRARKRAHGSARAIAAAGLPDLVYAVRQEGGRPALGEELAHELLDSNPRIDGIICNSDVVAFGVLKALHERGRKVPADIGVVGFGDSEAASYVTPSLSTIKPDRHRIGELTAELIVARINGEDPRTSVVDWELLARDSTRSPFKSLNGD
ncbi:LacI family transcriptional regulator [Rhizobium sp. ERR 922]|uniref:LacI family DNA-binding transcriptional regulator n=1 Tax=Rhizobium TaxID=379 RepID=UPI0011AA2E69|nr:MULTISPECIES: LacI family DNA-binding transcriptional regulator [Rhizobium]MCZ3379141.1 LacI family DNA-binding transcriptional regulator [Rhizobium sp. AG207R]TWB53312.1 LacI family transcriptional regulator [Rhizobium sp. ERR 922]TWB95724.1 LacI family transcriptional regulator [Rhizobium sp. ERR 942]GES40858.1 LacI family transcriptional regulator [Rhizobium dioscoreae]